MASSRLLITCTVFIMFSAAFYLHTEAAFTRIPVTYGATDYKPNDIMKSCGSQCPSGHCCICEFPFPKCVRCICDENEDSRIITN
ncbi:hypothetical protein AgCh_033441 [Apium graveolens]